jgi:hypothetical protein
MGAARSVKWKYPQPCPESIPVPSTVSLSVLSQLQQLTNFHDYYNDDDDDDGGDDKMKGDDPVTVMRNII